MYHGAEGVGSLGHEPDRGEEKGAFEGVDEGVDCGKRGGGGYVFEKNGGGGHGEGGEGVDG